MMNMHILIFLPTIQAADYSLMNKVNEIEDWVVFPCMGS